MAKKVKLTSIEKVLYETLKSYPNFEARPSELIKKTSLSPRNVRKALKKLQDLELVSTKPDFMVLRSHFYYLTESTLVKA